MKVLLISKYHDLNDSVASLRSKAFVDSISKKGYQVEVLSATEMSEIKWVITCLKRLVRRDFDLCVSTHGPFLHMLPVAFISYIFTIKLVLDLRDPWAENIRTGYGKEVKNASWKSWLADEIEKYCFLFASEVWVCTPGMFEYYKKYNSLNKVRMIPNGYQSFRPTEIKLDGKIRIVCAGKFAEYGHQKALATIKKLQTTFKSFHLTFIGSDKNSNMAVLEEAGIASADYIFTGKIPSREVQEIIHKSQLGLVLIRNEQIDLGTKAFDYVGAGLMIFGIFNSSSLFSQYFEEYIWKGQEQWKLNNNPLFARDYHSDRASSYIELLLK